MREFRLPLLSEFRAAEFNKIEGYARDTIAFRARHFEDRSVNFAPYPVAPLGEPRQRGVTEGRNRVLGLHKAAAVSALAAACIESKFCAIHKLALKIDGWSLAVRLGWKIRPRDTRNDRQALAEVLIDRRACGLHPGSPIGNEIAHLENPISATARATALCHCPVLRNDQVCSTRRRSKPSPPSPRR